MHIPFISHGVLGLTLSVNVEETQWYWISWLK